VITFATNSSALSQNARLTIRNIAQSLSGKRYTAVSVMGFAVDRANEEANVTLSGQRAMAVARELSRYGINRTKIKIEVFGSQNPRFPTNTRTSNVRNQRVEIVVVD
jgi:outer membrane protein OmpA-like peptidoglycan-associated protein